MAHNLDLFDQPGAREQAGERQTDIEDLIHERPACRITNMPWAVYRCDRIQRGQAPTGETPISGHLTLDEAMDEANRLQRADRAHSYVVGLY